MTHAQLLKAIEDIRKGRMVILVDDEDRENEGDLCLAAEHATPEAVNFMARYGRGLICLALEEKRIRQLDLPMMVANNTSQYGTAFTVSIEARSGVSTGISAADRSHTILTAMADDARPADLARPGHVFPLRAQPGGVLVRVGQTEGSVDLTSLAGLKPGAVICEVMNEDGSMARMPDLEAFAVEHDLTIVSIADIIRYRLAHESLIQLKKQTTIQHRRWGEITVAAYDSQVDTRQHLVITVGDLHQGPPPLVRVHTGCAHCDVFGDLFCDCGSTLNHSMGEIVRAGRGVLIYLHQDEGSNIPLDQKISTLEGAQRSPYKGGTQSLTLRRYGTGAQILRALGLHEIRLLANRSFKLACLEGFDLSIKEVIAVPEGDELDK